MDVPAGTRALVGQVITCMYKGEAREFAVLEAGFREAYGADCVHLGVMDMKDKVVHVVVFVDLASIIEIGPHMPSATDGAVPLSQPPAREGGGVHFKFTIQPIIYSWYQRSIQFHPQRLATTSRRTT